jgi:hypothetical protein
VKVKGKAQTELEGVGKIFYKMSESYKLVNEA